MVRKQITCRDFLFVSLWILYSSSSVAQECGDALGNAYRGVIPYSNAPNMGSGTSCGGDSLSPYGYKWQCVEFIKRFHGTNNGPNRWNPNNDWAALHYAYKYYGGAAKLGLDSFPNGGTIKPKPDDIIVFDQAKSIGDIYGHIAIVTNVTETSVTIVEQNSSGTGYTTLSVDTTKPGYYVNDMGKYPVLGWLHVMKGVFILKNNFVHIFL